jgi:TolA-binding protein
MFGCMRIVLVLMSGFLALPLCLGQTAEPASAAATAAALRNAEENSRRLAAEMQNMTDTQDMIRKRQETLQQRIDSLEAELRALRTDFNRSNASGVSREDIRDLALKLREVDEKREADKQLILKSIRDLAKTPPPAAPPPERRQPQRGAAAAEAPYEYSVKKGDRLLDILAAYNHMFEQKNQGRITLDQVIEANPQLKNPNNLRPGQTIYIPVPR